MAIFLLSVFIEFNCTEFIIIRLTRHLFNKVCVKINVKVNVS